MRASNWLILLVLTLLCTTCRQKLSSRDFIKYIQSKDSGLGKDLKVGGLQIRCQYEPAEYVLLKKYRTLPADYKKELDDLKKNTFYSLTIIPSTGKITEGQSQQEYEDKYSYYNFSFQQDLFLEVNGERHKCILFYFNSLGNQLGEKAEFVLGFPVGGEEPKDQTLVIDSDKLQTGILKVFVSAKDIQRIPELKI